MTTSLYQRLGNAEGINAIVDNAVDRHAVNPLLAPRFSGADLPRAKRMGALFFCMGAGGPQQYDGRDLRTVHAGMNISEQEMIATIDDFVAAMHDRDVGATEVNEVVAILYSLKGDVIRV